MTTSAKLLLHPVILDLRDHFGHCDHRLQRKHRLEFIQSGTQFYMKKVHMPLILEKSSL